MVVSVLDVMGDEFEFVSVTVRHPLDWRSWTFEYDPREVKRVELLPREMTVVSLDLDRSLQVWPVPVELVEETG